MNIERRRAPHKFTPFLLPRTIHLFGKTLVFVRRRKMPTKYCVHKHNLLLSRARAYNEWTTNRKMSNFMASKKSVYIRHNNRLDGSDETKPHIILYAIYWCSQNICALHEQRYSVTDSPTISTLIAAMRHSNIVHWAAQFRRHATNKLLTEFILVQV